MYIGVLSDLQKDSKNIGEEIKTFNHKQIA